MKEVQVTCPQCGQNDAYFEYEKGDFTSINPPFIYQQPWKCRYCGYPEVNWNNWMYVSLQKPIVKFRVIDANGDIIQEWSE